MASEPRLPFDAVGLPAEALIARDEAARGFAVDPVRNVVLEASAGTGKTHVLVTRYINLLRAGVDPANILAITFTRKAAAEMRERIVRGLRALAGTSAADAARWASLRDRLADISISTIDAFCFALLREFPLEADLDPAFDIADETMTARLADEAVDAALGAARRMASKEDVALLMAALGERRVRRGLAALVDRRLTAGPTLRRFLAGVSAPAPSEALARVIARLQAVLASLDGGLEGFIADGPGGSDAFALVAADLRALAGGFDGERTGGEGAVERVQTARAVVDRVSRYFLNDDGEPRHRPAACYRKSQCRNAAAWARHSGALRSAAPLVAEEVAAFERSLNGALVQAMGRLFRIARWRYRQVLEAQALVDFPEGLARTLRLLRRMDEFAQSRYRLEARYHHVLVDEFQDTNRAQWGLVARLIESWGEGMGLAHEGPLQPSIFIVGDRKQSIYGFRDADVRMIGRAHRYVARLRPGGRVRKSIARSFRAEPELLAFANDLFSSIDQSSGRADAFCFKPRDRFPVDTGPAGESRVRLVAAADALSSASVIASEVERLLAEGTVRDRETGVPRPIRPGDIAILFRSRASHREIESALEARAIPTYVYKGLGFFDADEVKDLMALVGYLARPSSPLWASALLRSRLVRVSDRALRLLAPAPEAALTGAEDLPGGLSGEDRRVLERLRASLGRWLALVDRLPPAELLDRVIADAAYAFELGGPRLVQARENLKKIRSMTRRLQNRGYATMARVADHLDRLSAGDESNAVVDALDSVNLMTVHAAKGLEFPVVFLTNLTRGTGGRSDPMVIAASGSGARPLISVAGGLPEAEAAARERDREETKRLLYVAVTRARERLYLAAVLKQGRFQASPGSLGEVLPASLRAAFVRAAGGGGTVEWQAERGGVHLLGIAAPDAATPGSASLGTSAGRPFPPPPAQVSGGLRRGPAEAPGAKAGRVALQRPDPVFDLAPLTDTAGPQYISATAYAMALASADEASGAPSAGADDETGPGRMLIGTLVHRLFQASQSVADPDAGWLTGRARELLTRGDGDVVADSGATISAAVEAFIRLRRRPDLSQILARAECEYELPFSLRLQPSGVQDGDARPVIVRGSIDCLARQPDGAVTIIEFKTGRRRAWHRRQLDLYVRAAQGLLPAVRIEGRIFYLNESWTSADTN